MPKPPPPRKSRRRPRAATVDTSDVFKLLAEGARPSAPEAWFAEPWRDGAHAADLVTTLAVRHPDTTALDAAARSRLLAAVYTDIDDYWFYDDLRAEITVTQLGPTLAVLALMRLRIAQLKCANSHGGGHGYNAILIGSWHRLTFPDAFPVDEYVLEARRTDALGCNAAPRRRAAFASAWRAGLYRVAFALGYPPAAP